MTNQSYTCINRKLKTQSPIKDYLKTNGYKDLTDNKFSVNELSQTLMDIFYTKEMHDKQNPTIFILEDDATRSILQCHIIHRDQIPEKVNKHLAVPPRHFFMKCPSGHAKLKPLGFQPKQVTQPNYKAAPEMNDKHLDPKQEVELTEEIVELMEEYFPETEAGQRICINALQTYIEDKLTKDNTRTDPSNDSIWFSKNHQLGAILGQSLLHRNQLTSSLTQYFARRKKEEPQEEDFI